MYYSSGYVTNRTVAGVRGRREGVGNTVNGVDELDSLFRGNSFQDKLSVTMIVLLKFPPSDLENIEGKKNRDL
jgi:hypothetical protein